MITGIIWAILAGLMLGLYALPNKFTKDFKEETKVEKLAWPDMALQLDAYRHGLRLPEAQMINIFIDRETGLVKTYEWTGTYFEQFKCLLSFWQLSKDYRSAW